MCRECDWVKNIESIYVNNETMCAYIGIPKCASTFIINNIEDTCINDEFLKRQGYVRVDMSQYLLDLRGLNYFTWTFIRDPVERFRSAYTEFVHCRVSTNCWWKDRTMSDSITPKYLLEYLSCHPDFEPHTMRQISILKYVKRLDFVGKLENWEEDAAKLHDMIGVTFDNTIKSRSAKFEKPILTPIELELIQKHYILDTELYDRIIDNHVTF